MVPGFHEVQSSDWNAFRTILELVEPWNLEVDLLTVDARQDSGRAASG